MTQQPMAWTDVLAFSLAGSFGLVCCAWVLYRGLLWVVEAGQEVPPDGWEPVERAFTEDDHDEVG